MPKYNVFASGSIPVCAFITVEAENKEEAEEKVREMEEIEWQEDAAEINLISMEEMED